MASKYAKLNLPAFQQEPTYQEKIDGLKTSLELRGLAPGELGKKYKDVELEIDAIENQLKEKKAIKEALSQELLVAMEDDDLSSFKMADGTLLYAQQEPYSSVKDKSKFTAWIKKMKFEHFLSVNYQTMNGMVKDRLTKGETVPPGVDVFMKSSVRMRKS